MKKFIVPFIVLFSFLYLNSCQKNNSTPVQVTTTGTTPSNTGMLIIYSTPAGASIYLMGTNTNKITPDSINNLEAGTYDITLKCINFFDTSFSTLVHSNMVTTESINLTSISKGDLSYLIAPNSPSSNYIISFYIIYGTDIYITQDSVTASNGAVYGNAFNSIFYKNSRQKLFAMLFGNGQTMKNPSGTWYITIKGYPLSNPSATFSQNYKINVTY